MTSDELRRTYARHLVAGAPSGRTRCVSPEALLALVERRGTEEERLAALDHAASCEACRHDLELLRAVHRVGAARTERSSLRWNSWGPRSYSRLAAAAVLVLVVGTVTTITLRRDDAAVMRGGSASVTPISPVGEVAAGDPLSLKWHAVPGADRYSVELLGAAGDSIFATITRDTALTLPATVPLMPDRDYLWSVRAELRDGTHAVASPLRFRIRQR